MQTLVETQKVRRGHDFYPPEHMDIPPLYATDSTPAEDTMIVLHYFAGGSDFWIAELDRASGQAFGYVRHSHMPECAEWGYVSLPELEQLSVAGGLVIVERDLYWVPVRFGDIKNIEG